ncbi:hypothetical protein [Novosphingobium sp.]|nr:hypothetical protein [Novosphingobium sp.]
MPKCQGGILDHAGNQKMAAKGNSHIREISAKWDEVLLVCRKCSRKFPGGFGKKGEQRLEKALKSELKTKGRYKVVPVSCLDICPKHAICLVRASEPGTVHLIKSGATMEDVIETLLPAPAEQ